MGNLVNPLSRILGFRDNTFWGNNFSFNYCNFVYRQKIFEIKCVKKIFKLILKYIFKTFDIPRVYYNLKLNFIGQANSILNIECNVHNLNLYNMAIVLILINSIKLSEVNPRIRYKFGIYKRRDVATPVAVGHRITDGEYAWLDKYGQTKEEAFTTVKNIITRLVIDTSWNTT